MTDQERIEFLRSQFEEIMRIYKRSIKRGKNCAKMMASTAQTALEVDDHVRQQWDKS